MEGETSVEERVDGLTVRQGVVHKTNVAARRRRMEFEVWVCAMREEKQRARCGAE